MNRLNRKLLLCLVYIVMVAGLLGLPNSVSAETQVSISVSDTDVLLADKIIVKFIVRTNSPAQEIKVKPGESPFEITGELPAEKRPQNNYTIFEKKIDIAFFKVGDFNIGPFSISLLKDGKTIETLQTNSIPVTVKTSLKEEDKDIKPLKNLIDIKGNPLWFWLIVLGVLLFITGIIFLVRWLKKRKNRPKETPKIILSPLEEFKQALNELWDKKFFEKGNAKLHFLELTAIIKRFMHRNYGFDAEDFTTYETLYFLKSKEKETTVLDILRDLMEDADLVKFAKFIPDEKLMNSHVDKLKILLDIYHKRIQTIIEPKENQDIPK